MKKKELQTEVDQHLEELIRRFYSEAPMGDYQKNADKIDVRYIARHNIETILRLRMKRWIDAHTIRYFCEHNPRVAKKWAEYTEDEMLHDEMFAADLKRMGVSAEQIYSEKPFRATKLLQGYFYYGLEHEKRPLASLCSSYFIEYTTLKTQPEWLENVGKILGKDYVKGQLAHVSHDEDEHHLDFVWDVVWEVVKDDADPRASVFEHIDTVYELFCDYFAELKQATVDGSWDIARTAAE